MLQKMWQKLFNGKNFVIKMLKITRALRRFIDRVKNYRLIREDDVSGKKERIGFLRSWNIRKNHPDLIKEGRKPRKK